MSSAAVRAARRAARVLTAPFRAGTTSPVRRNPLGVELLEFRETPATFRWLGGLSNNWAGYAQNWTTVASPGGPRSFVLPGSADDLRFDGSISNQPAFSLGYNTSTYSSISLVNNYTATVQTGTALTYTNFTLDAPGTYDPIADQTVTGAFTWKKGDLGGNGPEMTIRGTTATITPGTGVNGTLESGVGLTFAGSVVATISTGTLQFNSTRTITLTGSSKLSALDARLRQGVLRNAGAITLLPGGFQVFEAKNLDSDLGLDVQGGTAHMLGGGTVKFTGAVAGIDMVNVQVSDGALVIENGTTLEVGVDAQGDDKWVHVTGGKLASRPVNQAVQPAAVIKGRLVMTGGQVVVSDGSYTPQIQGHRYATLRVNGTIHWTGGTYKPSTDPANGATASDVWEATKLFIIGAGAVIDPTPDVGPITNTYAVLKAGLGITGDGQNPVMPQLDESWRWANGTAFGQKTWSINRRAPD
ncbi:MAG: hypothetical protein K2X82_28530 [Gemmataceae bacterium]|nr:hypothetical protein [Gemmataceae bacterium]